LWNTLPKAARTRLLTQPYGGYRLSISIRRPALVSTRGTLGFFDLLPLPI
jgi:hypothetical protein